MASFALSSIAPVACLNAVKPNASRKPTARPCAILSAQRCSFLSARNASLTLVNKRTCASSRVSYVTRMDGLHYWGGDGGMQFFLRDEKKILEKATLQPDQVLPMMESKDLILLDVREEGDFEDVHVDGAVNVPLYTELKDMDFKSIMKRIVYATNGMKGSQLNKDFMQEVQRKIPNKDAMIGVTCASGGTVEASSTAGLEGKKSRSLISMYRLMAEAGYTNVFHVSGGMRAWCSLELPSVGEDLEAWKEKAASMP